VKALRSTPRRSRVEAANWTSVRERAVAIQNFVVLRTGASRSSRN